MKIAAAALLVVFLAVQVVSGSQELYVRSHSLQAPFIDTDLSNRYWEFGGSTVVSTNQYVRLTPDRQSKKGWLWSKLPFSYQHWAVEFEFKIDGQGTKVFGDGMAFWVTRERAETGDVFGNRDQFTGLGIFFDTYANARHKFTFPFISAMIGDGQKRYSNNDDNVINNIAQCEVNFRKVTHPTKVKVKYLMGTLSVYTDMRGENKWQECFTANQVIIDGSNYLGFSAMTGDVADNHDIIRVTSYMITLSGPEQEQYNRMLQAQGSPIRSGGTNTVHAADRPGMHPPAPGQQEQEQQHQQQQYQPPPKGRSSSSSSSSSEGGTSPLTWILVFLLIGGVFVGGFFFIKTQTSKRNKRF